MKKKNGTMKYRLKKHRIVLRQKLFFRLKKNMCAIYQTKCNIYQVYFFEKQEKICFFDFKLSCFYDMNHTMYIRRKLGRACHRRAIHQLFTSFSL